MVNVDLVAGAVNLVQTRLASRVRWTWPAWVQHWRVERLRQQQLLQATVDCPGLFKSRSEVNPRVKVIRDGGDGGKSPEVSR